MTSWIALACILQQTGGGAQSSGWKVLLKQDSTAGWRSYRGKEIGKGWQIENGELSIKDAATAGDIVTEEQFGWFELQLEFNLGKGQNSGVMFHVQETEGAPWQTGPEVQLYDHPVQDGVETTGYLYQLYTAPNLKPKPAGEWNRLRLVVRSKECTVEVNGVKGYSFSLDSDDFRARVAKSKFAQYANFAKARRGHIALQGDHGAVKFRNIRIRELKD